MVHLKCNSVLYSKRQFSCNVVPPPRSYTSECKKSSSTVLNMLLTHMHTLTFYLNCTQHICSKMIYTHMHTSFSGNPHNLLRLISKLNTQSRPPHTGYLHLFNNSYNYVLSAPSYSCPAQGASVIRRAQFAK